MGRQIMGPLEERSTIIRTFPTESISCKRGKDREGGVLLGLDMGGECGWRLEWACFVGLFCGIVLWDCFLGCFVGLWDRQLVWSVVGCIGLYFVYFI